MRAYSPWDRIRPWQPGLRAGTDGTSTPRFTTGRTARPWAGVTSASGAAWPASGEVPCSNWDAARAGSRVPLAATGIPMVGVDRSERMLAVGRRRFNRRRPTARPRLIRGDIRDLPFRTAVFPLIIAPYGILQSLITDADLERTLESVARLLGPGGMFALDLVPDLPEWDEYRNRVRLRGRSNRGQLTLVESVRQDRARGLTIFDQEFVERRGERATRRQFQLIFRTLSVPQMRRRLATSRAGRPRGTGRLRRRTVGRSSRCLGDRGREGQSGFVIEFQAFFRRSFQEFPDVRPFQVAFHQA